MGLFEHHKEPETAEFMGLVLNAESLVTPDGAMPIGALTRAAFMRDIKSAGHGPEQTSTGAVVGGAVAGGVIFGAAGAVVGGLAGSTVKEDGPERYKTESVYLVFETADLSYSMDVPRDQEGAALAFAETVKRAMKHHSR